MLLGCIADDFTGATDLANTLTREGMPTIQFNGVPEDVTAPPFPAAAGVVALKTRSVAVAEAVGQSLAALDYLRRQGCRKFFFKYCSTFDSTAEGNIGPVAEALMTALETDFTVACPAFPENGRTVCHGHLFVGDKLLSDTGMRHHPLTPMTDSNLVRVLQSQCRRDVGLVDYPDVAGGPEPLRRRIETLRRDGCGLAVVDALENEHLRTIAAVTGDLPLLTGGSGLALGLPDQLLDSLPDQPAANLPAALGGPAAVLAGSCSEATHRQVLRMCGESPYFRIDPYELAKDPDLVGRVLDWSKAHLGQAPVLVYSSASPEELSAVREVLGRDVAGTMIEKAMGELAAGLVEHGVRRLIVAGGETSGAVVQALKLRSLAIGPEIDPGVPWTFSLEEPRLGIALKSGNFGGPDFFLKALEVLP